MTENYNLMLWHMRDDLLQMVKYLEMIQRWGEVGKEEGRRLDALYREIACAKEMVAGIVWRRS